MNLRNLFLNLLLLSIPLAAFAQDRSDVLLTINDKPVTTDDFKRVYKKNLDLVQDENQKTVDGYLDLFIDYKLKVEEAYDQGLNREPKFVREFAKYEDELSRKYIYEAANIKDMAKEAYQRGLEEREVSHILIMVDLNAPAQDTLKAFNKISEIRQKAVAGQDFKELAKQYSEEPAADERAGYLGYLSVFATVYPFETTAYNTAKGEISEIVRTQFGYHILKVHDVREREGDRTVSHIMTTDRAGDSTAAPAEQRIREIKKMLDDGADFAQLAKSQSEDKASGVKGGKLGRFNRGQLRSTKFIEEAYALEQPGDLSEPFLTEFGWHVVRLDEIHPVQNFEEQRAQLEKQVSKGDRARVVTNTINEKIKKQYGFKKGEPYLDYFQNYLPDTVLTRKFKYDRERPVEDRVIFTIADRPYTFEDFVKYMEIYRIPLGYYKTKEPLLRAIYDEFETVKLKEYFRERLMEQNEEYAATIEEYRNGLLLYELMSRNIWYKAKTDSVGLAAYYEQVKEQYMWEQRVQGVIATATSQEVAAEVTAMLEGGKSVEQIKEAINTDDTVKVIVNSGAFEKGDSRLPGKLNFAPGISPVYNIEGSFVVVKVDKVLPPSVKKLEETRGRVLNAYQDELERRWMDDLRKKYKVKIDKRVLRKLKKELNS
jgi:peptidyl-prolyl cis-trans isomerase SurA